MPAYEYDKEFKMCVLAQKDSISDKVRVGAVVLGVNKNGNKKYFSGFNIHVSDSFADVHAEQMAVNLCLGERYYPLYVFVTSQSKPEYVILCGSCRHYISEINELCRIIVFNPDGSLKTESSIVDVYPARKDVKKKNKVFQKLCGVDITDDLKIICINNNSVI